MKTSDRTIHSLCEEIDSLKESVRYWKKMYEEERESNVKQLNERLEKSKKDIGNALMFALAVKDDENGNLVISKKDRNKLAKNYSTKK